MGRLAFLGQHVCAVEGCDNHAPGSHPLCRRHAKMVPRDEYLRLRFLDGDDLAEILERYVRERS